MYEIVQLKELMDNADKSKELFVDTETGPAPTYEHIVLIQIYQEHWDKVKVVYMSAQPSYAVEFIWSYIREFKLVGANLIYDFQQFNKHTSTFTVPKHWEDTFYASRLKFPTWQEYSLDKGLKKVLGYDPYEKEGLTKKEMQKSFDPEVIPTHQQLVYASVDVLKLPALYHACKSVEGSFIYELDKRTAEMATQIVKVGMPVDFEKLDELEKRDLAEIKEAERVIGSVNVNSYAQVRELLGLENYSDELTLRMIVGRTNGLEGYEGFPNSPKMKKIHGKRTVHEWEPNYKHTKKNVMYAEAVLKKRKALKRIQFVTRAKANGKYDSNGVFRITSHFSPHAITGRVQGEDENLSQYPRAMKSMWGTNKKDGRVLIYADYSQLELRCITAILPERNMEEAYRNKIDLHTYAAKGLDIDENHLPKGIKKRFVAKQLNFLALYGGGKSNFQKTVCKLSGVWLDMDNVVSPAFDQWKKTFSGIAKWHTKNGKSKGHMDKTLCGRIYKAKSFTDLNSYKNQGTGAEIAKQAMNYQFKYNVVNPEDDVWMCNFVHDAYLLDCPDDPEVYIPVAKKLALCMQASWFDCTKLAPIKDLPMPVTVQVAYNWEDMEYEVEDKIKYTYNLEGEYMLNKNIEEEIKNVTQ